VKEARGVESLQQDSWVGWCCSYCAAPLETRAHGLYCAAEGRWFATDRGVHRLLLDERRRELLPFLELYQRVRRDEGWKAEPALPDVAAQHPQAAVWRARAARFREALELLRLRLGPSRWRVLEVGAGCCWASVRLAALGHRVAAVDVSLDPEDGLLGANLILIDPGSLPRAEADMEALPIEPSAFDVVLAADALHHGQRLTRTLVELRRVTRRGGLLVVLDSPVYRRREDGEAMVAERMRRYGARYGLAIPRESQSGYLVMGELHDLFRSAGWSLEVQGWPGRVREWCGDGLALLRGRRRAPRFPILLARRDG
jgi:SAM-dependent methyltransferase